MTTLMSRNQDGIATIGDTLFQVPKNETVLSILANNVLKDGDNFAPDGWVYGFDGQRRRKWFKKYSQHTNAKIWPPKLDNLKELEELRWKIYTKVNKEITPRFNEICDKITKTGKFYAKVFFSEKANGYVVFNKYEYDSPGISWSWIDENEKPTIMNQDLADLWFQYEKRSKTVFNRLFIVNEAFKAAVDKKYQEIFLKPSNINTKNMLHLNINNRNYFFRVSPHRTGDFFDKISFPEDSNIIKTQYN